MTDRLRFLRSCSTSESVLPSEGHPLLTDPACLAADSTERKLPAPLSLDIWLSLRLPAEAVVEARAPPPLAPHDDVEAVVTGPQPSWGRMKEDRLSHSDMALSRREMGSDKDDARREEGRERW